MRILADPNIASVMEAFSSVGEVYPLAGRLWSNAQVRDAEMLLVRSVTRVDAALLADSRVHFIASATSGIDHIDQSALTSGLRARNISFAHAPGSNAESVAEYVLIAVLLWCQQQQRDPRTLTAGIIGCGQVGSRVGRNLRALGIRCVLNDPPLAEQADNNKAGAEKYVPLTPALSADIITLHVPLTHDGAHRTQDLLSADALAGIKSGALLINTARGGVVDEAALLQRDDLALVWDCWQHEPQINTELLARAWLATPHIAGYSFDGKLRATQMIYDAACAYLGHTPVWHPLAGERMTLHAADDLISVLTACYDPRMDCTALKNTRSLPAELRAQAFDDLRRDYRVRREFSAHRLKLPAAHPLAGVLSAAGFQIV